ncbi:MAG: dihydrodipicolinate reductase [Pseudomonadota bacterium]
MRLFLIALLALPLPAHAADRITSREGFLSIVEGRRLVGDGVSLTVQPNGQITGRGFGLRVSGSWTWENEMFCRTLETTLRDFPRDCQTVERRGGFLRFQANQGAGDIADLRVE